MACPGLHCPGCSEGQSLGIAAAVIVGLVVADETVRWVAERIWWIGGTVAVCFALSIAASMWLERWHEQRGREWGADRGIYSRADYIAVEPQIRTVRADSVPSAGRPALGFRDLHIHLDGVPQAEQAAVIRQALGSGTIGLDQWTR